MLNKRVHLYHCSKYRLKKFKKCSIVWLIVFIIVLYSGKFFLNSMSSTSTKPRYVDEIQELLAGFITDIHVTSNSCPLIPKTCQGRLDPKMILKNVSLDKNVIFFDEIRPRLHPDRFYLKKYIKNFNFTTNLSVLNSTSLDYGAGVELGGHWKPTNCRSLRKTAVIIPYSNRLDQLNALVYFLHLVLQRQMIDYRIVVVESFHNTTKFNKGRLFNIGKAYFLLSSQIG